MATQFNADDKKELASGATTGVLSYAGRGLPSWENQPEGRNFLHAFKELFTMVADLQADVAELSAKVDELAVEGEPVEVPAVLETPATETRPGTDQ